MGEVSVIRGICAGLASARSRRRDSNRLRQAIRDSPMRRIHAIAMRREARAELARGWTPYSMGTYTVPPATWQRSSRR